MNVKKWKTYAGADTKTETFDCGTDMANHHVSLVEPILVDAQQLRPVLQCISFIRVCNVRVCMCLINPRFLTSLFGLRSFLILARHHAHNHATSRHGACQDSRCAAVGYGPLL